MGPKGGRVWLGSLGAIGESERGPTACRLRAERIVLASSWHEGNAAEVEESEARCSLSVWRK